MSTERPDSELLELENRRLELRVRELESRLPTYVLKEHAAAMSESSYNRGLEDGRKTNSSYKALEAERDAAVARVAELEEHLAEVADDPCGEDEAFTAGAAAERAAIVAWMKKRNEDIDRPGMDGAIWARCIESAAHLPAPDAAGGE